MRIRCGLFFLFFVTACGVAAGDGSTGSGALEKAALWAVLDVEPMTEDVSRSLADSLSQDFREELSKYVNVMDRSEMLEKLDDSLLVQGRRCHSIECVLKMGELLGVHVVAKPGVFEEDGQCGLIVRIVDVNLGILTRKVVEVRPGACEKVSRDIPACIAQKIAEADSTAQRAKELDDQ